MKQDGNKQTTEQIKNIYKDFSEKFNMLIKKRLDIFNRRVLELEEEQIKKEKEKLNNLINE